MLDNHETQRPTSKSILTMHILVAQYVLVSDRDLRRKRFVAAGKEESEKFVLKIFSCLEDAGECKCKSYFSREFVALRVSVLVWYSHVSFAENCTRSARYGFNKFSLLFTYEMITGSEEIQIYFDVI